MKANVINKRGITIVTFEGHISYARAHELRKQLKRLYASKRNQKMIFNLEKLEFVGSSGIRYFIDVFKELTQKRTQPRFYGISAEFEYLFEAFRGRKRFKIFSDEKKALKSYRIVKKSAKA